MYSQSRFKRPVLRSFSVSLWQNDIPSFQLTYIAGYSESFLHLTGSLVPGCRPHHRFPLTLRHFVLPQPDNRASMLRRPGLHFLWCPASSAGLPIVNFPRRTPAELHLKLTKRPFFTRLCTGQARIVVVFLVDVVPAGIVRFNPFSIDGVLADLGLITVVLVDGVLIGIVRVSTFSIDVVLADLGLITVVLVGAVRVTRTARCETDRCELR